MTDKITRLHPKPRLATCTGAVPSENPDAPHIRLDGLRKPTGKPLPLDLVEPDALERLQRRADIDWALEALDKAEALIRTAREAITGGNGDDAA